jgi:uncharacterized protein (TIGR03083 family)
MATAFDTVRSLDRREMDRLGAHLAQLDDEGWREQSYCVEWRVYQVVSHLASGMLLGSLALAQWLDGGPPVSQEQRQRIWAHFDALAPEQMHGEFRAALQDYYAQLDALPSTAGQTEVETFLGTRPVQDMLALRLHEVVLHTWDVLVARDRSARIPADTVELLRPVQLQLRSLRTPALLAGKRVRLRTSDGQWQGLLDFGGDKPAVMEDPAAEADLTVEAPGEELCRLLSGRHFLPGSLPRLTWQGGSYQEVIALNIFAA